MAYFKQRELKNERLHRIAEEIAVRVGYLARCPLCGTTYEGAIPPFPEEPGILRPCAAGRVLKLAC
jgi:hypothetical protein